MDTVPSGHHTWAELPTLVGAVRRLALDRTLPPAEAMGQNPRPFRGYDDPEGGALGPFA